MANRWMLICWSVIGGLVYLFSQGPFVSGAAGAAYAQDDPTSSPASPVTTVTVTVTATSYTVVPTTTTATATATTTKQVTSTSTSTTTMTATARAGGGQPSVSYRTVTSGGSEIVRPAAPATVIVTRREAAPSAVPSTTFVTVVGPGRGAMSTVTARTTPTTARARMAIGAGGIAVTSAAGLGFLMMRRRGRYMA